MSIYAVNGKTPIAAWIPSLDTAGNGTTTLTDLVGSNNGTLTDMDPATDWVADTGAGGVRALDFDASNDVVLLNSTSNLGTEYGLSFWYWPRSFGRIAIGGVPLGSPGNLSYGFYLEASLAYHRESDGTFGSVSHGGVTLNAWTHWVLSRTGGTVTVFKNGVSVGVMSATFNANFESNAIGARSDAVSPADGLLDDIRFFDQSLNADDVTALYAAGFGRGITFGGTTIQTRRRRDLGGYGL